MREGDFAERGLVGVFLHFVQQGSHHQLGVHTWKGGGVIQTRDFLVLGETGRWADSPPETTALSRWTRARTSCEWFLKVLVLTQSLLSWSTLEEMNWNCTTVPSDVPAARLHPSC